MGCRERQCQKVEGHLFHRCPKIWVQGNHEKRSEILDLLVEAAMPCKVKNYQHRETCGESDNRTSKRACIVQDHESTRKRLEGTLSKDHEDHIATLR